MKIIHLITKGTSTMKVKHVTRVLAATALLSTTVLTGALTVSAKTAMAASTALKHQNLTLTILPGSRLGPDGKMHDTYSPADETIVAGVPTTISIYNYDTGTHSFTASALGVNIQAKASKKNGVPAVTTYTFTPKKTGDFTWVCLDKCDGAANGWAMRHNGYMMGTLDVVPNHNKIQYVYLTIKDGLHYAAADKKLHDSYSPADFTVQRGIPVKVTVTNFDTGNHSMTSSSLGLNQVMKGAKKEGVPTVTTFTFTPKKDGKFAWRCVIPCDGGPTGWAMTHDGYMSGFITVQN